MTITQWRQHLWSSASKPGTTSPPNTETPANLKSWEPTDKDEYGEGLYKNIIIEGSKPDCKTKSNSDKVDTLDKIFMHTAVQYAKPKKAY